MKNSFRVFVFLAVCELILIPYAMCAAACRASARWRVRLERVGREDRSRQGWLLNTLGVGQGSRPLGYT